MKFAVIGATGNVGSAFVAQALERGHDVLALSRSGGGHSKAERLAIDILDTDALAHAIDGCDAIVSAIGSQAATRAKGMHSIVSAATLAGIERVLGIGGAGILELEDGTMLFESNTFPAFLKTVTQDHLAALAHLEASRLQWTFICPGAMTEGPPTGDYRHQGDLALDQGNQIRFSDVAHLALECIEDTFYLRQKVAVAY